MLVSQLTKKLSTYCTLDNGTLLVHKYRDPFAVAVLMTRLDNELKQSGKNWDEATMDMVAMVRSRDNITEVSNEEVNIDGPT